MSGWAGSPAPSTLVVVLGLMPCRDTEAYESCWSSRKRKLAATSGEYEDRRFGRSVRSAEAIKRYPGWVMLWKVGKPKRVARDARKGAVP